MSVHRRRTDLYGGGRPSPSQPTGGAPEAHPVPWPLPPEDRAASPYTGWSRAHWEATADGLLDSVDRHASPGRGLILLPGRHSWSGARSDGLEGNARTFLLAGFRIAGAAGDDPHGILQRYADGLAAGTRTVPDKCP